mmetsp:Transcript_9881/g.20894  ORF Transcript_9881/g.20894 Transcript_9881/m.20894 type:complete len:117 (-) Transcript_9881:235-585(-)
MAEELASGIVLAAEKLYRKDTSKKMILATISAGEFPERGSFFFRDIDEQHAYFDFFEEAYNHAILKGYERMDKEEEKEWKDLIGRMHSSVPGGLKYNAGKVMMVLGKISEKKPEAK